jgi:hypothetical protein
VKKTLVIVDDFDQRIEALTSLAEKMSYAPREYEGHFYSGIGELDTYWPGTLIERALGFAVKPVISFFRLGVKGDKSTTWIHNDLGVVGATHAGLLYLSDPPAGVRSGTAFWRHKSRNITEQADGYPLTANGAILLNEEGQTADAWEETDFVSMRRNRFICYPANVFHSRIPQDAFGADVHDGRLIWVAFFTGEKRDVAKEIPA